MLGQGNEGSRRGMMPLGEISATLDSRGYGIYPNRGDIRKAVRGGRVSRLFVGTSYITFPKIGGGYSITLIKAYLRENGIAQPAIRIPNQMAMDHEFGEGVCDQTMLYPEIMVILNGFRVEKEMIAVILEEGSVLMTRAQFQKAVEALPDMVCLDAVIAGFQPKSLGRVTSNSQLVSWLAIKKNLLWKFHKGKIFTNYREKEAGGEERRYFIQLKNAGLDKCEITISFDGTVKQFPDEIDPRIFNELWRTLQARC